MAVSHLQADAFVVNLNYKLGRRGLLRCCNIALTVMLILAVALFGEAKPFIEYLNLKKDTSYTLCQVFRNKDTVLYITGTGPMNAAVKSAAFLATEPISEKDYFLNIGVCGAIHNVNHNRIPLGTPIMCNKIIEMASGHTYYPDILYSHPFYEGPVITSYQIITWNKVNTFLRDNAPPFINSEVNASYFADMEASALYQAVSCFFKLNRIFFLKIVSDYILSEDIETPSGQTIDVNHLINMNVSTVINWIQILMEHTPDNTEDFNQEELNYLTNLSKDLKLSVTMEYELKQYLRYYKLLKGAFIPFIETLREKIPLVVQSKAEGKKYLDYFKKNLL